MIDKFLILPISLQIIILISLICLLIVFMYLSAKYGFNFNNGKGLNIGFIKDNKIKREKREQSIIFYFKEIRNIEKEIFDLKRLETIKNQMNIVEDYIKLIVNLMLKNYAALLKNKNCTDPINTNSCKSYIILLKIIEERLINKTRFFIRENHFSEYKQIEFDLYSEDKTNYLIVLVTETLNDLYYYFEHINRSELYDKNQKTMKEFKKISKECFNKCRLIAIQDSDRIKNLENKANLIFTKLHNLNN